MAIPNVDIAVTDGALGIALPNVNGIACLVGVSSSGTANTVYQFGDATALKAALGNGPLVEAAALLLAVAGGPVICVPTAFSAGTLSAVVHVGTGLSVVTTTGSAPVDTFSVLVEIMQGGTNPAAGTATFRYSMDAGFTYSAEIEVPTGGVYAIPGTGVILNWSAATLVAGDTYTFTTVAPAYSVGQLNSAIDAVLDDQSAEFFLLHAVGIPADGTAAAALFAALDAKATEGFQAFRYFRTLMNSYLGSDSAVKATFAPLASTRVSVATSTARQISLISGSQNAQPAAYSICARLAAIPPSEDAGRVATGPLAGVLDLTRDEAVTPGFDVARLSALRSFVGQPGKFITNCRLLASPGSDFQLMQYGRVMDIACRTARQAALHFLNDSILLNSDGLILESEAQAIEAYILSALRAAITQPGFASNVTVAVSRTENILSTQTLPITVRVLPLGYSKFIEVDLGFNNPQTQIV